MIDFDKLLDSLSGYLETKIELIKLDIEHEVQKLITKAVLIVFMGLAISLAVVLLSIGASLLINELLESEFLGFVIISGGYLLIAYLVYLRRDAILKAVAKGLTEDNEQTED